MRTRIPHCFGGGDKLIVHRNLPDTLPPALMNRTLEVLWVGPRGGVWLKPQGKGLTYYLPPSLAAACLDFANERK